MRTLAATLYPAEYPASTLNTKKDRSWNGIRRRGSLPNITTLTGRDGQPFKWEDFSLTVDLDDPFFRQLR
ncbi:hypothetical protein [Cohnella faecalis]|uniref:hypothetical protein n=1 Tax=Cohnella faecalis TaxID=2315694 RepID=UPI001314EE91|nr:hypothetical protein [Cohnella faecalis]